MRLIHIVDDEAAIRRSAGFMLKASGFAVSVWESGVSFLREAKQVETGCVLLDVRMPEMDGLEVQQALTERAVTMPVIMLTGHGDIQVAVRALRGGAVDFIEKPFEKATLLNAIETAFETLGKTANGEARAEQARAKIASLTDRERNVLEGLANG